MNTRRPRTIGSPVSPHSLAKNSAPTPNAAAPLFTPFEIVPPTNIFTSVSPSGLKVQQQSAIKMKKLNACYLPTENSNTTTTVRIAHIPACPKPLKRGLK